MSDDLVAQIKERRLHHMYPHHLDELLNEAATALSGARAEIEALQGVLSDMEALKNAYRDDCLAAESELSTLRARAEKAESALAEAVEALRPVASREMQNINDEVDNYGTRYQSQWFADAMASARAFIAEHGSDSKGE